jgi:hypothetical protein
VAQPTPYDYVNQACVQLAVFIGFVLAVEASLLVYVALITAAATIATWRLHRRGPLQMTNNARYG